MLNILYGIIAILVGIYFIWSTARKTEPIKSYYSSARFKIYAGGIIFIMIGIVIIIKRLLHLF